MLLLLARDVDSKWRGGEGKDSEYVGKQGRGEHVYDQSAFYPAHRTLVCVLLLFRACKRKNNIGVCSVRGELNEPIMGWLATRKHGEA